MRRAIAIAIALVLVLVACTKGAPPPAKPTDVLGVASAASVDAFVKRMSAFVDAVAPGQGKTLTLDQFLPMIAMAGGPDLSAFDFTKPFHVVLLDPKTHPKVAVFVGAVK